MCIYQKTLVRIAVFKSTIDAQVEMRPQSIVDANVNLHSQFRKQYISSII